MDTPDTAAPADPYASLKAAGAALLATGQVAPSAAALAAATAPAPAPEAPADVLDMIRAQAPETAAQAAAVSAAALDAPTPAAAAGDPDTAILAAATAVAAAAPVPTLVARIISDRPRSKRIVLDWPVALGDVLYAAITVARPTTAQVQAYYEAVADLPEGARIPRFPVFFADDGSAIPDAVHEAMDDDDGTSVYGAVSDFLPIRLRLLTASPSEPSTPPSGDATEPKSSAS